MQTLSIAAPPSWVRRIFTSWFVLCCALGLVSLAPMAFAQTLPDCTNTSATAAACTKVVAAGAKDNWGQFSTSCRINAASTKRLICPTQAATPQLAPVPQAAPAPQTVLPGCNDTSATTAACTKAIAAGVKDNWGKFSTNCRINATTTTRLVCVTPEQTNQSLPDCATPMAPAELARCEDESQYFAKVQGLSTRATPAGTLAPIRTQFMHHSCKSGNQVATRNCVPMDCNASTSAKAAMCTTLNTAKLNAFKAAGSGNPDPLKYLDCRTSSGLWGHVSCLGGPKVPGSDRERTGAWACPTPDNTWANNFSYVNNVLGSVYSHCLAINLADPICTAQGGKKMRYTCEQMFRIYLNRAYEAGTPVTP